MKPEFPVRDNAWTLQPFLLRCPALETIREETCESETREIPDCSRRPFPSLPQVDRASTGNRTITVTATGGGKTHTLSIPLTIQ